MAIISKEPSFFACGRAKEINYFVCFGGKAAKTHEVAACEKRLLRRQHQRRLRKS
jgi:hypothetical protein